MGTCISQFKHSAWSIFHKVFHWYEFINPLPPGSRYRHRKNSVWCFHRRLFSYYTRPMLEWTRWKKAYPGSCIYGDWPLCVVKKWKGRICMKITSFTIGPIWSPGNGNVEAWAFSPCKAKRTEHAAPLTENEPFSWWPVWPSEAETLGVGFEKKNSRRQWVKIYSSLRY